MKERGDEWIKYDIQMKRILFVCLELLNEHLREEKKKGAFPSTHLHA
jgi:hypothetical protein